MIRLGFSSGGLDGRPVADLVTLVRTAEDAGFEMVIVAEARGRDAFVLLGHLAAVTTRIKLATGIVNVFSRTPAALAMAAATLDELSGGRAILGLGVSTPPLIEQWHGVHMERPIRRMREVTQAVRAILLRDPAGWAGETLRVAPSMPLAFRPPRETIAIYHASLGPAAIRLAGSLADGWLPYLLTPETLRRETPLIDAALLAAGRPPEAFTVAALVPALLDGDDEVPRLKRTLAAQIATAGPLYRDVVARQGYREAADRVQSEWLAGRRDAAVEAIPTELVEAIALFGSAARCRAKLEEYEAAGVDIVIVAPPAAAGPEAAARTIRALAAIAA